jgi:pilus assembly protein CpaE
MLKDSEARLLWATLDEPEAAQRDLILDAGRELRIVAQVCSHTQLFELARPGRFDLVGIELGVEPREGLALIRQLHERYPRLAIIAAIADSTVSTLRAALEAGAGDIVSLPLTAAELHKALIKFRQLRTRDVGTHGVEGEIITLYGARGGLGTTTMAVNLAVQLAALGPGNVALVDLDLQRGDVATFLNLNPMESIAAVASAPGEVDEIFLHGMLTRHPSGVSVLSAPQQIEEGDAVGHDEMKLVLGLLRSQFRYVVVDTPRTITGPVLPAFENADRIFVLTDLSIPSIRATRRFVDLLERLGVSSDRTDVLVTKIIDGPVDVKDAGRSFGKEPLLLVPRDETAASAAMNTGVPINGSRPSPLGLVVAELAARIAGVQSGAKGRRGGFLRRIFKEATS